jgi:hypothetical protein
MFLGLQLKNCCLAEPLYCLALKLVRQILLIFSVAPDEQVGIFFTLLRRSTRVATLTASMARPTMVFGCYGAFNNQKRHVSRRLTKGDTYPFLLRKGTHIPFCSIQMKRRRPRINVWQLFQYFILMMIGTSTIGSLRNLSRCQPTINWPVPAPRIHGQATTPRLRIPYLPKPTFMCQKTQ